MNQPVVFWTGIGIALTVLVALMVAPIPEQQIVSIKFEVSGGGDGIVGSDRAIQVRP